MGKNGCQSVLHQLRNKSMTEYGHVNYYLQGFHIILCFRSVLHARKSMAMSKNSMYCPGYSLRQNITEKKTPYHGTEFTIMNLVHVILLCASMLIYRLPPVKRKVTPIKQKTPRKSAKPTTKDQAQGHNQGAGRN